MAFLVLPTIFEVPILNSFLFEIRHFIFLTEEVYATIGMGKVSKDQGSCNTTQSIALQRMVLRGPMQVTSNPNISGVPSMSSAVYTTKPGEGLGLPRENTGFFLSSASPLHASAFL